MVALAVANGGLRNMSFDRLAPHYRWMEAVGAGGLMQRCRLRWLNEIRPARRALLAGEGNGRMLEACARALPQCDFTVLDQSQAMLDRARRRWERSRGSQTAVFRRTDLLDWREADSGFDLVVTHFFLDCFTPQQLSVVIRRVAAAASPTARWLVADFAVPPAGWRRRRARLGLALAYGFFRLAAGISARRLTNPDSDLAASGFALRRRERFDHGLLHTDLWIRGN